MDFNLLFSLKACLFLSAVFAIVISTGLNTNVTRFKFWIRKGTKLRPENVMKILNFSAGILLCAEECSREITCISASWNNDGTSCLLSTANQIDDDMGPISDNVIADAAWKTASKIRIPVFHVASPGTRYTFTYAQAKDACKSRGGVMASASDLIYARSLGYNLCSCGWMTEGWIGLVQQTAHICIAYRYSIGIIACEWLGRANAYCKHL